MSPAFFFREFRVFRGCNGWIRLAALRSRALAGDGPCLLGTKTGPFLVRFLGGAVSWMPSRDDLHGSRAPSTQPSTMNPQLFRS